MEAIRKVISDTLQTCDTSDAEGKGLIRADRERITALHRTGLKQQAGEF